MSAPRTLVLKRSAQTPGPLSLSDRILKVLSDGRAIKANKLRKLVFASPGIDPTTTWDDFKDAFEVLVRVKAVSKTIQPETVTAAAHEVVQLTTAVAKAAPAAAKRAREEKLNEVTSSAKKAKGGVSGEPSDRGDVLKSTMDVPAKFLPMLLRQQGKKIKNIEINSKTRINAEASGKDEAANDELGSIRTITITGSEEKHLRTARVLLNKMLSAFTSFGKTEPGVDDKNGGEKGKGSRDGVGQGGKGGGNGGKGGKGGDRGKGKGNGGGLSPVASASAASGDDAKAKKRDRKFY